MKFVFKKKKIVLKTKTNLHPVNQKNSKGKKMKRKEMNKGTGTSRRHRSYEQEGRQNVDVKV